jgi:two-component system alkaline phosphatase synthesis response regulator PhoP
VVGKNKPFIVFIISGEFYVKKLSEELEIAGFRIQVFEKESLALKFLEKNNVQGIFLTNHSLEKSKALVEEIKKTGNPAALFCSQAQCSPENIAELLNLGCDEFFLKTCPDVEIIARIKAVFRRSDRDLNRQIAANVNLDTDQFNFCGATIKPSHLEIIFDEKNKFKLGKKELGIIYYLASNPGVVISRNSLIRAVWGAHADTRSRSVDQYITKIRVLFEKYAQGLGSLRTLHGIGYWYDSKTLNKKKVNS